MPKVKIGTYSQLQFNVNGKNIEVPVTDIFCEDDKVPKVTKEVGIFDKYSSKKAINSKVKDKYSINEYGEIIR